MDSIMDDGNEFKKFLTTITAIEKKREFDRQVDRLKKSSSATTIWAVIPALFGFHGIAHFYLNRPLEGLLFFFGGIIPGILLSGLIYFQSFFGFYSYTIPGFGNFTIAPELVLALTIVMIIFRVGLFIFNIISARYQYSRYDFFIHIRAKKPWNNWGLQSQI